MKKRYLALLLIFVLSISTVSAACKNEIKTNDITTTTKNTLAYETSITPMVNNVDVAEESEAKADNGGGYIESGKYRQRYYSIPYNFIVLVDETEYEKWYEEIYEYNPDKSKLVSFIQYFNISKEAFEKANLQMAKDFVEIGEKPTMRPLDYENQQTYEIYNADIIYTFDDEIINEYYLTPDYPYCAEFEYENAIANGTYQTQTTDWIDLAQMEAEINAKYGEPEVTETTTTVDEA